MARDEILHVATGAPGREGAKSGKRLRPRQHLGLRARQAINAGSQLYGDP